MKTKSASPHQRRYFQQGLQGTTTCQEAPKVTLNIPKSFSFKLKMLRKKSLAESSSGFKDETCD